MNIINWLNILALVVLVCIWTLASYRLMRSGGDLVVFFLNKFFLEFNNSSEPHLIEEYFKNSLTDQEAFLQAKFVGAFEFSTCNLWAFASVVTIMISSKLLDDLSAIIMASIIFSGHCLLLLATYKKQVSNLPKYASKAQVICLKMELLVGSIRENINSSLN